MPRGGARRNSGGARLGAGRKSTKTESYQAVMRGLVETLITPADWATVLLTALSRAKAGDRAFVEWLGAWVMGKVPEELKVTQTLIQKGYRQVSPDDWPE